MNESVSDSAPSRRQPNSLGLGLLVLGLLLVHAATALWFVRDDAPGSAAAWSGFPLDDAWIHLVYARALSEGQGPAYNTGQLENGFTSPLWMAATALVHGVSRAAGGSVVLGIKLLGVILGWLASVVGLQLLRRLGVGIPVAFLGALLLGISPVLSFAEVSGMEISLTILLILAAFERFQAGSLWWAGLAGGLALLARPEAAMAPAMLSLLCLWSGGGPGCGRVRALVRVATPGLVLLAAWVLYSLTVTGRPLPNTFYAKYQGGGLTDPSSFTAVLSTLARGLPSPLLLVGLLAYASGVVHLLVSRGRRRIGLAVVVFPWAFVYGVCASRPMPSEALRYFYWWRYLLPALPFVYLTVAAGLRVLLEADGSGRRNLRIIAGAVAALLLAIPLSRFAGCADQYAWNCQNIEEMQVALGRWVADEVPEEAVIAVNDAGALRYFGGRHTLDLMALNRKQGLVEREQARDFDSLDVTGKQRWLEEHRVDYLVIFPSWFPDLAGQNVYPVVHQVQTSNLTICNAPPPGLIGQNVKWVLKVSPDAPDQSLATPPGEESKPVPRVP